ncbi:MAG: LutC/YkgG family protein [Solirubrobacteraceae bacterium]
MSNREEMLARVREALADVPADEPDHWDPARDRDPAAAYARVCAIAGPQLVELFEERCSMYRANVVRCGADAEEIRLAVGQACARHEVRSLVIPADLELGLAPTELQLRRDDPPLSIAALDDCDGTLTGCALAIALTGTIVLDAGPGQGRRALTLLPDLHVCVVRAEQIVHGVPQALETLYASVFDGPLTFISGPSATSDIELKRVEGVHGPRRLEVVLAV